MTFASLFDTLPRNPYASYDPDPIGGQQPKLKDESLLGALPQKPAVASPPPFVMSEETPAERQAKEEEVQKTANAKKEQELSDRMKIDEVRKKEKNHSPAHGKAKWRAEVFGGA